jgi:hypothetical protein
MWTGMCWEKVDLFDIGQELEMQLGHDGGRCPVPEKNTRVLIAVDTSGMRKIRVRFCGCQPLDQWKQLMRARLYPSSDRKPRSCWTFEFLDMFIKVSLQGKLALYDFYLAILHQSHNTATSDLLVSHCYLATYIQLNQYSILFGTRCRWSPVNTFISK